MTGLPIDSVNFSLLPPHVKNEDDEEVSLILDICFPTISDELVRIAKFCLAYIKFLIKSLGKTHPLASNFTANAQSKGISLYLSL